MNFRYALLGLLLALGLTFAACGNDGESGTVATPAVEGRGTVELTWWGHAMFLLTAADGTRVLFDPYGEIGYSMPTAEELAADVVTVSQEHGDHNNVALAGDAAVLRGLTADGWAQVDDVFDETRISLVESFHDASEGADRGRNAIFVVETAGIRFAHLGDFGEPELTPEQLAALGQIDVLLVPTGGTFTIDAQGAAGIVGQIGPRIAIPMHYGTDALVFDLQPVAPFIEGTEAREIASSTIGLDIDALPAPGSAEIWVLEPEGG